MNNERIAASTGQVDKRTINGNNGTRRGRDLKQRKPRHGYFVLKDEVKAGLRARFEEVVKYYGGMTNLARAIGVSVKTVNGWHDRGMISVDGASLIQKDYRRRDFNGFRATYCRPDIKFDNNGKPLERKCSDPKLLRYVKKEEALQRGLKVKMTDEQRARRNFLNSLTPEERKKEIARYKEEKRLARLAEKQKKVVICVDSTDC